MATSSYFGRNAYVSVGEETGGYGTPNTSPTVTRPIISCSMLRQIEKVERPNLRVAGVAGVRKGHFIASDKATGNLTLEATYDNIGYFIQESLGAGVTSAGTVNTHTYSLGDVPVAGTTMYLQRGTDDNYEDFEGCVFSTFTFSCSAGEIAQLSLDIIAETSGGRSSTSPTPPSFSEPTNENLVLHHHCGNMSWNSTSVNLSSFEYKLENGLTERMRLGSLLTKQPVQGDYRTATVTVEFETDDAQYAAFLADNQSDLEITFNNGGAGAANRQMTFKLNSAYISEFSDEVSETGLIMASVTFKAEGTGSSGLALGTQIVVMNETTKVGNG